ncbi:MAG: iron-sulfur cluster repair protein YtfE [Burkholderiales bacterium]|nr:iron-sulfur cluster repair protein YtfE [Burkholderiales bacterium]ODU67204.1 MAG: iron-sulfur cluster repair di-iron protein [Lautropia sp. SCN 66-9]
MNLIDQSLGELARNIAGATRLFHEYQLDFCCGGRHSLREAAQSKGLNSEEIVERLAELQAAGNAGLRDWNEVPPAVLIDHIVQRYHETHRADLPELIRLARKVEQVHGERADCPLGLAEHLNTMHQELVSHMQKEEQVLFPMIKRGMGAMAQGPITVMRMEHDDHGQALQRMADLTDDLILPRGACNTWRALYLGLRKLREELMEHIHLENNVLFEKVLETPAGHA